MKFQERGSKNSPSVLILENSSAELTAQLEQLAQNYRVIIPTQKQSNSDGNNVAAEIEAYVETQLNGNLYALCGTPEYWAVVGKILSGQRVHAAKVIVESAISEKGSLIVPSLVEDALEARISLGTSAASL